MERLADWLKILELDSQVFAEKEGGEKKRGGETDMLDGYIVKQVRRRGMQT